MNFKKFAIPAVMTLVASLISFSAGHVSAAGQTQQYGPYASTSPDEGTCGNAWATDTFDRHFKVSTSPNADGTYTVTEQFKRGSFVTIAGLSPGSCDTNPGGTVGAGVTGSMHGSFTIIVTGGTFTPVGECGAEPCTTVSFIATHFPGATYAVPTFQFHYSAGPNGQWKNASADRGGNHGDITGAP